MLRIDTECHCIAAECSRSAAEPYVQSPPGSAPPFSPLQAVGLLAAAKLHISLHLHIFSAVIILVTLLSIILVTLLSIILVTLLLIILVTMLLQREACCKYTPPG